MNYEWWYFRFCLIEYLEILGKCGIIVDKKKINL